MLVELDRGAREPLSAQLERQLRDAVRRGTLLAGTPLPSTRALAAELGVSRGLVVAAYAQLGAEGYLQLRQNAAPVVATGVGRSSRARTLAADPHWRHNLRPDLPDYAAFPRDDWLTSYRAAVKRAADAELGYGDVRGVAGLRESLVSYLGRARGVVGEPEHTFVCGGFAQAMTLLGGVLSRQGKTRIGVEDPGHVVIRQIVARSGLEPVPIPVDELGIDASVLAAEAPDAVLVTPAHQFPTGVVMAPRAPRADPRLGGERRRDRDRGRLRRRVPLRPPSGRRAAGPDARARRLLRLGEQDAGADAAARLDRRARSARPGARRRGAVHRDRAASPGAARVRRLPAPGRARPPPAADAPALPAPSRRARPQPRPRAAGDSRPRPGGGPLRRGGAAGRARRAARRRGGAGARHRPVGDERALRARRPRAGARCSGTRSRPSRG